MHYEDEKKARSQLIAELRDLRTQLAVMQSSLIKRAAASRLGDAHDRQLFEIAQDGVVLHELATDPAVCRFLQVNPAICRMLGYTSEELLRLSPVDIQSEQNRQDVPVEIQTMDRERRLLFRKSLVRRDGRRVPVEVHSTVFEQDGKTYALSIIRDLSQRLAAEEALRLREAHLQMALSAGHMGTWEWDLESGQVVRSAEFHRLLGRSAPLPPLRDSFFEAVHPDDREELRQFVQSGIDAGNAYCREVRVLWPDGSIHWLEIRAQFLRDAAGKATHLVGVNADITERKRAEEALRQSEQYFRRTFDQGPIGAAIVTLDYRFQRVNEALCRITGYSPEELTRCGPPDITHPDDVPGCMEQVGRLAAGEMEQCEMDKRYIRKDGQTVWVHLSVRMLRDPQGRPLYYLPMAEDITARKQAEDRLSRSQRQLAEAQRLAHLGSWDWDIRSNTVRWSDEHYRIFGLRPEEMEPSYEGVLSRIHPDDRELLRRRVQEALDGGGPYECELRAFRPDGSIRHVHSQAELVRDDSGRPIRMIGTVQDITERKQAEDALRESVDRFRLITNTIPHLVWSARPLPAGERIPSDGGASIKRRRVQVLGNRCAAWPSQLSLPCKPDLKEFRTKLEGFQAKLAHGVNGKWRVLVSVVPFVCIIDDDLAVRDALRAVIESAGLRAETFESAEQYLAQYEGKECGCLLLDLRLGQMSGLQLLERLRARNGRVAVIVMTGHGDIPAAVGCMKLGAVDFLEKPLDHEALMAKIHAALQDVQATESHRAQVSDARQRLAALTPRERELLEMLVAGKSSKQIAAEMALSPATVSNHRAHLLAKTRAENTADMVRLAVVAGFAQRQG